MITYVKGDATQPVGDGLKMIAHIVNDEGKWGSGFVVALGRAWPLTKLAYHAWDHTQKDFRLGAVQFVTVRHDIDVANMIAQHGVRHDRSAPRAVQYVALTEALTEVADAAARLNASVHMPRIGCGLGGGTWDKVEPIINETLTKRGVPVTVYDLEVI
jgi:O-acetyl-ADP-ribose deacetylase (regulator of RNase III)